ncbi:MAR-binding filament-like protein 1-1 [Sesamum angolense]|uniref:MAR-binding filament-like protein 1-1 n=1 Tax=Sesamum angolense TaxID=2727404 RepID=A0AAE2C691_9LAMI|nr:MAR-binding filament-like protein 1-1 [Sesamum angolense]
MGFATGSSSFLHHSLFLPPSSPCILQPPFSPRNGLTPRKNRTAISCSQQEITPKYEDFCKRRAILFVGFSLIPLLNMRAEAVEGIAAENTEVRTLDQKQKAEQSVQGKPSQNPFLSLLNGLGFLGSGVLAALYASLKKEKAASDATIESPPKGWDEKRQLQEQLKEKLDSVAALQERVNSLSSEIKDKDDNLQNVNSKLVEKERELSQLNSIYQQAQEQLSSLNSEIQQLKDVLQEKEKELELKNVALKNLKAELTSSFAERDESHKKLDAVLKEYDQFKSSAENKAALDAKLLGEREEALHQLEEQLEVAKNDVNKSKVLISDLTQEKDKLTKMLNIELKNVKHLEQELKITQESLENSRSEASELSKQLHESRLLCSELEDKVSRIEVEFSETRDSLQREVNEVKLGAEVIAGELRSTKELLSKSNDELQMISRELAGKVQRCENLEKELDHTHRKAESAALALEVEKNIVASLNKELKVLETQISRDREARKSLEADLEDATKSLDEMNQETLKLSRELELASSRISSIEDEKEALYRSLDDQKQLSQEARENLEDAHNLIMRLGNERDGLEKRGKKLEEELASAKGEILRLRSQMNTSKNPAIDQHEQKLEVGSKSDVSPRKVTRRRKVNQQQEDS